jgi:hypothetical protein
MTDEYTRSKTRVEEGEGFDQDNWENTTNEDANSVCPNNNPFVTFGQQYDSSTKKWSPMNWWINYHWSVGSGTWANSWFNSNFDPEQFFEFSEKKFAITNAVAGSSNRIRLTISDPSSTIPENGLVLVAGVGGTTEANGRWLAHIPPSGTLTVWN